VETLDPMLADLRAEVQHRLPPSPTLPARDIDRRKVRRIALAHPAVLRIGVLTIPGQVVDVGAGGVFMACSLLVEINERGTLELPGLEPTPVRVVWIRGSGHMSGPGAGLAFDSRDAKDERRALELVLALLDGADESAAALGRAATNDES
jgi:hypothetical protein